MQPRWAPAFAGDDRASTHDPSGSRRFGRSPGFHMSHGRWSCFTITSAEADVSLFDASVAV